MTGTRAGAVSKGRAVDPMEEHRAALALARVEGLGPATVRRAIDARGSAQAALAAFRRGRFPASRDGRPAREAGPKLLERLHALEPAPREEIEAWTAGGIRLLSYGAAGYPEPLRHLHDPPVVLFLQGPGPLPGARAVTVIGARAATDYGRRMARDLACGFVRYGWTVVSGMARGIDAEAQRATLDAGGHTVGVLAGGLLTGRGRLHEAVRARGLLVSEIEPPFPADRWAFPRRNRLLAALGRGVVVVQAGARSGTTITVDHALEIGREVFAVPGPVGPPASEGIFHLLRTGARLVRCAEDVLEELGEELELPLDEHSAASDLDVRLPEPRQAACAILQRIKEGPADANELIARAGISAGPALALLTRLELAGWLRLLDDGRYARREVRPAEADRNDRRHPGGRRVGAAGGRAPRAAGKDGTEPPMLA